MASPDIPAKADHGQRMATFQRNGSRETKRSLVRAAVALWRVQGYDDTTIADICRAAGVSKGLFYFYFGRKEDLLFEVGALSSASLIREADARLAAGAQLGEVIRGVAGVLEQAMRRNPPVLVMESVIEGYRRERAVREAVENSPDQSLRVFSKVFARAVSDGQLPPGFEVDRVALLAQTVLSAAARHWASGLYADRSFVDEVVADLELLVAGGTLRAGGRR